MDVLNCILKNDYMVNFMSCIIYHSLKKTRKEYKQMKSDQKNQTKMDYYRD